jgi:hypothetical protein
MSQAQQEHQTRARQLIEERIRRGLPAAEALSMPAVREEIVGQIAKVLEVVLEQDVTAADAGERLKSAVLPAQAAHQLYRALVGRVAAKRAAEEELRRLDEQDHRRQS